MITETEWNVRRMQRAARTIRFYKEQILKEGGDIGIDDVTDFLTDLRHLCDVTGIEFSECLSLSERHHEHERTAA